MGGLSSRRHLYGLPFLDPLTDLDVHRFDFEWVLVENHNVISLPGTRDPFV